MTQIELANEETELLKDVVDFYLSELGMEIKHTDAREFRENLKGKKEMLLKIRSRLDEH